MDVTCGTRAAGPPCPRPAPESGADREQVHRFPVGARPLLAGFPPVARKGVREGEGRPLSGDGACVPRGPFPACLWPGRWPGAFLAPGLRQERMWCWGRRSLSAQETVSGASEEAPEAELGERRRRVGSQGPGLGADLAAGVCPAQRCPCGAGEARCGQAPPAPVVRGQGSWAELGPGGGSDRGPAVSPTRTLRWRRAPGARGCDGALRPRPGRPASGGAGSPRCGAWTPPPGRSRGTPASTRWVRGRGGSLTVGWGWGWVRGDAWAFLLPRRVLEGQLLTPGQSPTERPRRTVWAPAPAPALRPPSPRLPRHPSWPGAAAGA